jgi:hypothetical protein
LPEGNEPSSAAGDDQFVGEAIAAKICAAFLAAPANFETEIKCGNRRGMARTCLSLVPREMQIEPNMRGFSPNGQENL